MLQNVKNIKFFETQEDLLRMINNEALLSVEDLVFFENNSIFKRFNNIGIKIE